MTIRYGTQEGRWVLAAAVLGSGVAFLDGTVVNVALPEIGRDLHASLGALQWTVDAYLVTLSSLLLLGGSLGDRFGRRAVFVAGLVAFVAASLLCGVAPSAGFLIAARGLQGVGGALLVPGSLSIISATFDPADRAQAVGAWSGLAGVATAFGPFVGGWLIDAASWRLVFLINIPIAAAAGWIALRHVPESRDEDAGPLDLAGAALVTIGLAGVSYAAIEREPVGLVGVLFLVAFVVVERTGSHPMLPLSMFRSRQFTGANLTTFAVYAGLGGALFLVVLRLQVGLGYSALEAGASLVPFTILMFAFSPSAGRLAQRIGPRVPMTVGPLVAGAGLVLLAAIDPGDGYGTAVLPGVVVFGAGMVLTVAPLTAAVLAGVDQRHTGVASGINNAVARLAGLLAVAVLPALAGISSEGGLGAGLDHGYSTALLLSAGLCAAGGLIAALLVTASSDVRPVPQPDAFHPCHDPCVARDQAA